MKFYKLILGLMLGCCATATPLVYAQEQSQSSVQQQATLSTPTSSASNNSSIDSQGIRIYLLGPGDTLDIRVFGQPDMNWTGEVDSDGNVSSLPFIETPVRAQCRTEKDVQKDVIAAYSKYLKNPQISVRITGRNSRQPAIVFGAVTVPQRVQMQRRVRLSELITASGGVTERANGTIQILHTEQLMCPEPGEKVEPLTAENGVVPFKVYKIADLLAGKKEANPLIRPGDIVTASVSEPVYITGSVIAPQGIYHRDGLTLGRALAQVGGARKEAKATDVRIYRQKPGSSDQEVIHVDYAAIKKQKQKDVLLQAYDIIEVPEAGIASKQRLTQTLIQGILSIGPQTITGLGASLPGRVLY
ncbi:MAG: polysaccharide biosynthesis/export family protein [Pyrinomonadaceae bacterium]